MEWNGKGIPPIGAVCEYYCLEVGEWRKCDIVAHYFARAVAVDMYDSSAVCLRADLFRPLKTPEHNAEEEERLEAIGEMISYVGHYNIVRDAVAALYDAGYRKTEENK